MRPPRRLTTRKLLVASLGVAAISYLGCGSNQPQEPPVSGNLMPPPPPPMDAGSAQVEAIPTGSPASSGAAVGGTAQPTSQPTVAATPQPSASALATPKSRPSGSAAVPSLPIKTSPVVGNLMAPRPIEPKK